MKNWIFLFTIFTFCNSLFAQEISTKEPQKKDKDIWSGRYRVVPVTEEEEPIPDIYYIIKRTVDADIDAVNDAQQSDLARWHLTVESDFKQEKIDLRRFLFTEEDDEYKQFGWHDLHKQGNIHCVDGGTIFICKTAPNTNLKVGTDETFYTKSGIFGVLLHFGVLEFYKVETKARLKK